MKAIVTKAFPGKPDEGGPVRDYAVGDEITGDLARVAVESGWAKEAEDESGDEEAAPRKRSRKKG